MVYILGSSDTGVPLLKCLLAGVRLSYVTMYDTWVVASMVCPLGSTSCLLTSGGVPAARE